MLNVINALLLKIGDPVLDWMLRLPRDLALVILALLTALVLTVVRRWTTDQDLMRRCKDDKDRLHELIVAAKRGRDKEAVKRIRTTVGQIGMISMKAEGWPLLASLPIIAVIAVWAFSRIAYFAPAPGEAVEVKFFFSDSEIGKTVFLLPEDGVTVDGGLVRRIEKSFAADGVTVDGGVSTWQVRAEPRRKPYVLQARYQGRLFERPLVIDGRKYAEPLTVYPGQETVLLSQLELREYKPAGIVPGLAALAMQPWIIGYLIIVIPLSLLLKPMLRIY